MEKRGIHVPGFFFYSLFDISSFLVSKVLCGHGVTVHSCVGFRTGPRGKSHERMISLSAFCCHTFLYIFLHLHVCPSTVVRQSVVWITHPVHFGALI